MGQPLASPLFGKDNLPVDNDPELGGHAWTEVRKATLTRVLRIDGTFRVMTIHGGEPQVCHDGFLALDSQGHPYPIDLKVFEETFEAAQPESNESPGDVVHVAVPAGQGPAAYDAVMELLRADDGRSPGLEENVTVSVGLA